MPNQKVTTFITFDGRAEEAVNHYTSIFPGSKITSVSRYGDGAPMPKGTWMSATFELAGQTFMALNAGGPNFAHTDGISLFVACETQDEVDNYWRKLSDGGSEGRCGWLKDKFGVSWQIIPSALGRLLSDPDPKRSHGALMAMLQMNKIDIAALEAGAAKG